MKTITVTKIYDTTMDELFLHFGELESYIERQLDAIHSELLHIGRLSEFTPDADYIYNVIECHIERECIYITVDRINAGAAAEAAKFTSDDDFASQFSPRKKLNWDELMDKYGELEAKISTSRDEVLHVGKLKYCPIEPTRLYFNGDYYCYWLTDYELHEDTIYITLEYVC